MKDGGSAFPVRNRWDSGNDSFDLEDSGMTLRDYFAGQALVGLISVRDGIGEDLWMDTISKRAYKLADCMIAVSEERHNEN
jgi:hypothetical protein